MQWNWKVAIKQAINILDLDVLISLMIDMNIFVVHTYDITIILEIHMLTMQLSRFFKNASRKKLLTK